MSSEEQQIDVSDIGGEGETELAVAETAAPEATTDVASDIVGANNNHKQKKIHSNDDDID